MAKDPDNRQPSTSALLSGIFKASELSEFLEGQGDALSPPSLPAYLEALCREKGILRAEVIRRSELDRSFGFQIFQGAKNPSRDKVLQLAVGFGLSYEETQTLLKIARKSALYPRIRRDAAIIYCLERRMSMTDLQSTLSGLGITILGKEKEAEA